MATDTDGLQALVRGLAEAMYNEPGDKPVPMATADADEVIRAQLTENTGTHFLDSGSAYGRHHEENAENPPWEQPEWDVGNGYVVQNVYHHLDRTLDRDRTCVSLEAALYAYAFTDERERDSWLTCMEGFANALLAGEFTEPMLRALGLPDEFVADVLGVQADLGGSSVHSRQSGPGEAFTLNTYNGEFGALSQVLQGTNLGGPYADYVLLQVHQGCDVRGGYTGPRVYSVWDSWHRGEFSVDCERCGWHNAESCLYDTDQLLYQSDPAPAELHGALLENADHDDEALIQLSVEEAMEAHDSDHYDGAVFHIGDACGGVVRYM